MILATVDLQVTSILPMNFESIALLVQEKRFKTDFQDGCHGRHLDFLSERFEVYLCGYVSRLVHDGMAVTFLQTCVPKKQVKC